MTKNHYVVTNPEEGCDCVAGNQKKPCKRNLIKGYKPRAWLGLAFSYVSYIRRMGKTRREIWTKINTMQPLMISTLIQDQLYKQKQFIN